MRVQQNVAKELREKLEGVIKAIEEVESHHLEEDYYDDNVDDAVSSKKDLVVGMKKYIQDDITLAGFMNGWLW